MRLAILFLLCFCIFECCFSTSISQVEIAGKKYFIDRNFYNKREAKFICEKILNAHLVVFETPGEQNAVAKYLFKDSYPEMRTYWTDAVRTLADPTAFVWGSNGESLHKNIDWLKNQPNLDPDQNCTFITWDGNHGLVADFDFFDHNVICEEN